MGFRTLDQNRVGLFPVGNKEGIFRHNFCFLWEQSNHLRLAPSTSMVHLIVSWFQFIISYLLIHWRVCELLMFLIEVAWNSYKGLWTLFAVQWLASHSSCSYLRHQFPEVHVLAHQLFIASGGFTCSISTAVKTKTHKLHKTQWRASREPNVQVVLDYSTKVVV